MSKKKIEKKGENEHSSSAKFYFQVPGLDFSPFAEPSAVVSKDRGRASLD